MDLTHPFQQDNPDPKAFSEACGSWVATLLPQSEQQLSNLTNKPETCWTSRARRIAVNHQTVRDCIGDFRTRITSFPQETPGRDGALDQLDTFAAVVDGIIKQAQAIARDGTSLATHRANPPGIERLKPLLLDLTESAFAGEQLMPVIKLISDNPEGSGLEIVSIQLVNEDIGELLSLAEAFIARWKESDLTDGEQNDIASAEQLIQIQRALLDNIKTFLGLSAVLADLKEGKPGHG